MFSVDTFRLSRRLGNSQHIVRFSNALLGGLLDHLDRLKEAHSSGAVQSYLLLLGRVKCLDTSRVCKQVCNMLLGLSKEYFESCDDPDMCRLSSYGLTGCPYDTELFECALPSFITKHLIRPEKAAVTIVAQKQAQQNNQPKPNEELVSVMFGAQFPVTFYLYYSDKVYTKRLLMYCCRLFSHPSLISPILRVKVCRHRSSLGLELVDCWKWNLFNLL